MRLHNWKKSAEVAYNFITGETMKTSIARLPVETLSPVLEYAVVSATAFGSVTLLVDGSEFQAQIATSCLVAPSVGDRVLAIMGGINDTFVLSVLERHPAASDPTELNLEGDVTLHVKNGEFAIRADKGMQIAAREKLSVLSQDIEINAASLNCTLEAARIEGKQLECNFAEIQLLAERCMEIFGLLSQRCSNSIKMVEQHDELQAGSIRHAADETMTMQAKNMFQAAEENVRIDAEKIHLG